jgi:hypothetical protein
MGRFALLGAFVCKIMASVSTPNLSEIRCYEKFWSGFLCGVFKSGVNICQEVLFLFPGEISPFFNKEIGEI